MIEQIGKNEITIGPGPFGTMLNDRAAHSNGALPLDLADPAKVLHEGPYAHETEQVAVAYLQAGAQVITTNTFGLRRVVGDADLFHRGLEAHLAIARRALSASGLSDKSPKLVSVGPPSDGLIDGGDVDCYAVDDLDGEERGLDLYLKQLEPLARLEGRPGKGFEPTAVAMVETIGTTTKLRAAVRALAQLGLEGFVNLTLVDGRFLDGDDPIAAIREIESEINGHRARIRYGVNCCDHDSAGEFFRNVTEEEFGGRVNFIALNGANGDPRQFNGCSEHGEVVFDHQRPHQIRELIQNHPGIRVVLGCCGFSPEKMASVANSLAGLPKLRR